MDTIIGLVEDMDKVREDLTNVEAELTNLEEHPIESEGQNEENWEELYEARYNGLIHRMEELLAKLCTKREQLCKEVTELRGCGIFSIKDKNENVSYYTKKVAAKTARRLYNATHPEDPDHPSKRPKLPSPLDLVDLPGYMEAKRLRQSLRKEFAEGKIHYVSAIDGHPVTTGEYRGINVAVKKGAKLTEFLKGTTTAHKTGYNKKMNSYTEVSVFIPDHVPAPERPAGARSPAFLLTRLGPRTPRIAGTTGAARRAQKGAFAHKRPIFRRNQFLLPPLPPYIHLPLFPTFKPPAPPSRPPPPPSGPPTPLASATEMQEREGEIAIEEVGEETVSPSQPFPASMDFVPPPPSVPRPIGGAVHDGDVLSAAGSAHVNPEQVEPEHVEPEVGMSTAAPRDPEHREEPQPAPIPPASPCQHAVQVLPPPPPPPRPPGYLEPVAELENSVAAILQPVAPFPVFPVHPWLTPAPHLLCSALLYQAIFPSMYRL